MAVVGATDDNSLSSLSLCGSHRNGSCRWSSRGFVKVGGSVGEGCVALVMEMLQWSVNGLKMWVAGGFWR